jgi:hypothetical protein
MVTNWTSLGSPPSVQWGARPSVLDNHWRSEYYLDEQE